jgi:hypothetical protein
MKSLVWKNGLDGSVPFVAGCAAKAVEAVAAVMMNMWYQENWKESSRLKFVSVASRNRGNERVILENSLSWGKFLTCTH